MAGRLLSPCRCAGWGAIWPSPLATVRRIALARGLQTTSTMVKRFLIAAIIVGLFLGGVGYFNLVFKPKMIGEFMEKMVPPPATVTAEAAKTESWSRPGTGHRHAGRHRRRGCRAAVGRHGHRVLFRERSRRRPGRQAGQARHFGRRGRPRRQQGDAGPDPARLRAPGEAGQNRRRVASGARSDHRQARFRRRRGAEDGSDHRPEDHHRAVCRQARTAPCGEGAICRARSCAGLAAIARSDLGGLSGARRRHRQVQARERGRAGRRRLSGATVQGRGRGVRREARLQTRAP